MTIIPKKEKRFYIWLKKRFAHPAYFGQSIFAYSDFGDKPVVHEISSYGSRLYGNRFYADAYFFSGIYQVRTRYNHKTQVREKYYIPHNPRSVPQQSWRSSFAAAVAAWQNLTSEQKKVYNVKSYGKHKSGYNIFLGEYLKTH